MTSSAVQHGSSVLRPPSQKRASSAGKMMVLMVLLTPQFACGQDPCQENFAEPMSNTELQSDIGDLAEQSVSASVSECCQACLDDEACMGFVRWGDTCWLKGGTLTQASNGGRTAYLRVNVPMPPPPPPAAPLFEQFDGWTGGLQQTGGYLSCDSSGSAVSSSALGESEWFEMSDAGNGKITLWKCVVWVSISRRMPLPPPLYCCWPLTRELRRLLLTASHANATSRSRAAGPSLAMSGTPTIRGSNSRLSVAMRVGFRSSHAMTRI